jgi:hypothetical protein
MLCINFDKTLLGLHIGRLFLKNHLVALWLSALLFIRHSQLVHSLVSYLHSCTYIASRILHKIGLQTVAMFCGGVSVPEFFSSEGVVRHNNHLSCKYVTPWNPEIVSCSSLFT